MNGQILIPILDRNKALHYFLVKRLLNETTDGNFGIQIWKSNVKKNLLLLTLKHKQSGFIIVPFTTPTVFNSSIFSM